MLRKRPKKAKRGKKPKNWAECFIFDKNKDQCYTAQKWLENCSSSDCKDLKPLPDPLPLEKNCLSDLPLLFLDYFPKF